MKITDLNGAEIEVESLQLAFRGKSIRYSQLLSCEIQAGDLYTGNALFISPLSL